MSPMCDIKDIMMICAKSGVNAVTTCEEAIFPWNSSPHTTHIIHEASIANKCTITGTGGQETQYASLFALFGGGVHKANLINRMALPSGRKAGFPLADGVSPSQGLDKSPMGVIKSVVHYGHVCRLNGNLLNMKFSPLARVAGYGAYFNDFCRETQNEIISRQARQFKKGYKLLIVFNDMERSFQNGYWKKWARFRPLQ